MKDRAAQRTDYIKWVSRLVQSCFMHHSSANTKFCTLQRHHGPSAGRTSQLIKGHATDGYLPQPRRTLHCGSDLKKHGVT